MPSMMIELDDCRRRIERLRGQNSLLRDAIERENVRLTQWRS